MQSRLPLFIPLGFHRGMAPSLKNFRGMGNGDWGMGNGGLPILIWGMGNEKRGMGNEKTGNGE